MDLNAQQTRQNVDMALGLNITFIMVSNISKK